MRTRVQSPIPCPGRYHEPGPETNVRFRPIADISVLPNSEWMRAAAHQFLTAIIGLALLQPAAAGPSETARARMAADLLASVRCNLATTYRLAARQKLNVRAKPRADSHVIAQLEEGRIIYVCDENGDWLNVYFGGVEGPCFRTYEDGLQFREARKCRSGWVRQNWVNILSG